jgi:predicted dehydrogenase
VSGNKRIRAGIAGLDHFFSGMRSVREVQRDENADLIIVAHRDQDRVKQIAQNAGARWTTDYEEVVDADIDLLITACPTNQNADLVIRAAEQGKHILSVKPFAMNLAEADEIVAAVERAGVRFMSFDVNLRLDPLYRQARAWLQEGKLGSPISTLCLQRYGIPTHAWLGPPWVWARTWWLDPEQVPGGGWMDHAIYYVDMLRWLFDTEVERVSGEIANLKHFDEPLEDFGVATFVFENRAVAILEVTWAAEFVGATTAFHLVGTSGQLLSEIVMKSTPTGRQQDHQVRRVDYSEPDLGWQKVDLPPQGSGLPAHMLRVLQGQEEPIAGPQDSRATLAACLAFYGAAKELRTVTL